ncbi:MAG TPA: drug:proton antiporter, partial [Achromobacter sp.]|nr:drug:proton antiporter [Achromobacter sp.]
RARLLAAITMESRGGTVITEGTPDEKAQAVIDYLRTHSLIDY